MSEQPQQSFKYRKAGSVHTIRIRHGVRSNNVSPQHKQKQALIYQKNQLNKIQIGNLLKKIPKTVQLKDSMLIEGCFSYVDQGFQKWKIGKVIGKGNSCVRKAMNVKTGVISAVKQIQFSGDEEEKKLTEINILKTIRHANIVSYLEHYKIKNQTWIFMEYVPTNLKRFYLDFGPPPTQIFLKFAKQIISAMAYLQKKNILHRDIKCENILISNEGVLKLCDFGCSKNFSCTMSLKQYENNGALKTFKGSYLWVAPQCIRGDAKLASDIWSLGCTLVELASGKLPWHERNFESQLQAGLFIENTTETPKIEEQWDPKIKAMIMSCLKIDPKQRITAVQLLEKNQFWQ